MSIKLMSIVWELDLPPGEKLVLLALADQANDAGTHCFPSVGTIAKRSGQNERTVRRALRSLETKGHLTSHERRGTSTDYAVHPGHHAPPDKLPPRTKTTVTPDTTPPKPLEPISSEAKASSEKRAGKVDQFPCPAGVDRIDWQALLQNRKQKRAALSEGAHRQIVKKLNEWERDGWPPGPIVAHAAEMGWTSVFPTDEMKAKQNGRLPTSHNFRPEPAMALKRIAEAELAAEGSSSHQEFGFGTGLALPDYLTN